MEDQVTHIWEHALGVFYPGDLDIELIVSDSAALLIEEQAGGISFELSRDGEIGVMTLEDFTTSSSIEFYADNDIEIDLTVDGTIVFHPTNTYLPLVKEYLQNTNDLETIFIGLQPLDNLFASKNHTHTMSEIRDFVAPSGGTGSTDLSGWFELVGTGAGQYIRALKPFSSVGGISAYNTTAPSSMWEDLPVDGVTIDLVGGMLTVIGGVGGGVSSWYDLTDKPTAFTPVSHTHPWNEVTGKPATFDPSAHNHLAADLPNTIVYNDRDNTFNGDVTINGDLEVTGKITGRGSIAAYVTSVVASLWDDMPAADYDVMGGIMLDASDSVKFLRGDGTWQVPSGTGGSMVYPGGSGLPTVSSGSWGSTISPTTGYFRYTGTVWEFRNETYLTSQISHSDVVVDGDFGASNGILVKTATGVYTTTPNNAAAWDSKVSFPGFGISSTTACKGDDARLSDSRTPKSHDNNQHSTAYLATNGQAYDSLRLNGQLASYYVSGQPWKNEGYVTDTALLAKHYVDETYVSNFVTADTLAGYNYVTTTDLNNRSFLTSVPDNFLRNDSNDVTTGTLTAANYLLGSDSRLKFNIVPIPYRYHSDIRYKQFEYLRDPGQIRYGVIADEIIKNHPELVMTDHEGMMTVAYIDLLIYEVHFLRNKVDELERRLV